MTNHPHRLITDIDTVVALLSSELKVAPSERGSGAPDSDLTTTIAELEQLRTWLSSSAPTPPLGPSALAQRAVDQWNLRAAETEALVELAQRLDQYASSQNTNSAPTPPPDGANSDSHGGANSG